MEAYIAFYTANALRSDRRTRQNKSSCESCKVLFFSVLITFFLQYYRKVIGVQRMMDILCRCHSPNNRITILRIVGM